MLKSGWRLFLGAMLLGALAALALPPLDSLFSPLLVVAAFTGLMALLDLVRKASKWRVFILGWWFGFGYFVVGLYWIVNALGVDWAKFFWLVPGALLGVPAVAAIYPAVAILLTHLTRSDGVSRCLWLSFFWVACEWLRGHILIAFPWNLIGYIWMPNLSMLQVTSVAGIYGLSLLTILLASLPSAFKHKKAVAVLLIFFVTVWGAGFWRLQHAASGVENVTVRLVQPNIPQKLKWGPDGVRKNFLHLLELTSQPTDVPVNYVVWPESAASFFLNESPEALTLIARNIPADGVLFTGSIRREVNNDQVKIWNSMLVVDSKGEILATYDKSHLLAFGEYLPIRKLLPKWINKLTPGDIDYSAGSGLRTVMPEGVLPFSPLICFEAVFPGGVIAEAGPRPKWLLNITNDAWFGYSSGPFQHFSAVRVRAIEEGVPVVRAANTGISGIIDSYGRVVGSLKLNEEGVLDVALPAALSSTVYGRYGDWILAIMLAVCGAWGFICRRKISY